MNYKCSFCILSFNNKYQIIRMVKQLLSSDRNDIQIVVSDNASTDGTVEELRSFNDSRLKLSVNLQNIGFQKNMFKALSEGDGEYLYLSMGRDLLNVSNVDRLIYLLHIASQKGIDVLQDRRTVNDIDIFEGFDAVCELLKPIHATGWIFRKDALRLDDAAASADLKSIYPELYIVKSMLARNTRGGRIYAGVYTRVEYVTRMASSESSDLDYDVRLRYFYPDNVAKQFVRQLAMVEDGSFSFTRKQYDEYAAACWKMALDSICGWRYLHEDIIYSRHYALKTRFVSRQEIQKFIISSYALALKSCREFISIDCLKRITGLTMTTLVNYQ